MTIKQGDKMRDIFKPPVEPAASIYEAFQLEAKKRDGRTFDEWNQAEINAVHREAAIQSIRLGLRCPTLDEIMLAERCASGHTDYGAQWAYMVVNAMRRAK